MKLDGWLRRGYHPICKLYVRYQHLHYTVATAVFIAMERLHNRYTALSLADVRACVTGLQRVHILVYVFSIFPKTHWLWNRHYFAAMEPSIVKSWRCHNSQATEPSKRCRYFTATEKCVSAVAPCNFNVVLFSLFSHLDHNCSRNCSLGTPLYCTV